MYGISWKAKIHAVEVYSQAQNQRPVVGDVVSELSAGAETLPPTLLFKAMEVVLHVEMAGLEDRFLCSLINKCKL